MAVAGSSGSVVTAPTILRYSLHRESREEVPSRPEISVVEHRPHQVVAMAPEIERKEREVTRNPCSEQVVIQETTTRETERTTMETSSEPVCVSNQSHLQQSQVQAARRTRGVNDPGAGAAPRRYAVFNRVGSGVEVEMVYGNVEPMRTNQTTFARINLHDDDLVDQARQPGERAAYSQRRVLHHASSDSRAAQVSSLSPVCETPRKPVRAVADRAEPASPKSGTIANHTSLRGLPER